MVKPVDRIIELVGADVAIHPSGVFRYSISSYNETLYIVENAYATPQDIENWLHPTGEHEYEQGSYTCRICGHFDEEGVMVARVQKDH